MIGARVAVVGLGLLVLTGCASAHRVQVQRSDTIGSCAMDTPTDDTLVGVALSGGGTRAALFGAAGLQALAGVRIADGGSLVERITHLSSVSGGSLAATYYALKKPGPAVPVLDADGNLSEAYRGDRRLLAVSATKLVNQHRDRIVEFLNQS